MVGPLSPTQATFLHILHDNARRLVAIANNLIAVAESERGRLELNYPIFAQIRGLMPWRA